jgi:hypothetical protein
VVRLAELFYTSLDVARRVMALVINLEDGPLTAEEAADCSNVAGRGGNSGGDNADYLTAASFATTPRSPLTECAAEGVRTSTR